MSHNFTSWFQYNQHSSSSTMSPQRRAASPVPPYLRFSATHEQPPSRSHSTSKTFDSWIADRARRSSVQSKSKGKERSVDSVDSSSIGYDADPLVSTHYNASTSFTSYESYPVPARSPTADPPTTKKNRTSLLVVASDALGFKFGRKRKPMARSPPQHLIMPEVIEITAQPRRDEEGEERERLRDAAAQSIGLDPELLRARPESPSEEDEDGEDDAMLSDAPHDRGDTPDTTAHSMHSMAGRHRAGSLGQSSLTHSRNNSATPAHTPPVLPFPASLGGLTSLVKMSATLPKFYPPSSLLVYALAKQWKTRCMVLSSSSSQTTHLHLFKSSASDEREIERLEITEDSVIYVADEEVGGRGSVVKVGGVDVGAQKKELNPEEGGRTMWFLQMLDQGEAQQWIAAIKNAILSQRSLRAGLGIPAHAMGANEPRGDMDVMLSMRLQGIISTSQSKSPALTPAASTTPASRTSSSPSPPQSIRSLSLASKSSATGHTVSTIKGMFTTRSRSPSVDYSHREQQVEDSFGTMGNSLLTMLRTNGTGDVSGTPTHPLSTNTVKTKSPVPSITSSLKSTPPGTAIIPAAELKIVEAETWSPPRNGMTRHGGRSLPPNTLSLQPAPRKKPWMTANGPPTPPAESTGPGIYQQSDGNRSVAGSFGIQSSEGSDGTQRARQRISGSASTPRSGSPDPRERATSLQSVSTLGRHSPEVTTSGAKRWSRQGTLPKRLTPPSGPPPSVPEDSQPPAIVQTQHHPYAAERPPSSASSNHSGLSPQSAVSASPSFWKRTSSSSAYSSNTTSTSSSRPAISRASSKRRSMPPPRPAPNFAPPPAPSQVEARPQADSPQKGFRSAVAQRALRLSLTAPKPPPSTVLPPRPDEPGYSHRRSTSSGTNTPPTDLYSIPGSPQSGHLSLPPAPAPSSSSTRSMSIKQRLRILSAPSPMIPSQPLHLYDSDASVRSSSPIPPTTFIASPVPGTPIGEPITTMQNDPSFLQLATPITPTVPKPPPRNPNRPAPPEQLPSAPEITSLSPPPRRGSRQLVANDRLQDKTESESQEGSKFVSLSQHGSVISLGFAAM
ncbi:hypothetical protein BV22DRAFT_1037933 [Leucogyrophana mollusca]|uniref:Uncharacterized protein n=1 Tax=Leucogyrophana mollusca TaxID=85980 RepID=A0ACB8B977_9AGAM|nr:hypothetical protein BV22DRAFT_1037933 [Leucogyrophana mollusca]